MNSFIARSTITSILVAKSKNVVRVEESGGDTVSLKATSSLNTKLTSAPRPTILIEIGEKNVSNN